MNSRLTPEDFQAVKKALEKMEANKHKKGNLSLFVAFVVFTVFMAVFIFILSALVSGNLVVKKVERPEIQVVKEERTNKEKESSDDTPYTGNVSGGLTGGLGGGIGAGF